MRGGVAEGCEEVPTSECLPLEYNLDYMRGGVSSMRGVCSLGDGGVSSMRGVCSLGDGGVSSMRWVCSLGDGGVSSMRWVCSLGDGRCVQHARGVFIG